MFTPDSDDPRQRGYFPALTDDGRQVLIGYRWPGFVTNLPAKPVRVSVIILADRPAPKRSLEPDPYKLGGPSDEERVAALRAAELTGNLLAQGAA